LLTRLSEGSVAPTLGVNSRFDRSPRICAKGWRYRAFRQPREQTTSATYPSNSSFCHRGGLTMRCLCNRFGWIGLTLLTLALFALGVGYAQETGKLKQKTAAKALAEQPKSSYMPVVINEDFATIRNRMSAAK